VLIGHSMSGFMAACAAARDPEVAGLVMISAWNIGAKMSGPKESHRVDMIPSASSRLAGTTPAGLQAEAEANAAKWNYLDYAEALKTRPVFIVESRDRNLSYKQSNESSFAKSRKFASDRNLSGNRPLLLRPSDRSSSRRPRMAGLCLCARF
jgi:pimeloyl-ACP methyl ester carboxylesterase